MSHNLQQMTIRGLDPQTKAALIKKASQQGMSLNRYALKALQQSAGIDDAENRYQVIKQFLDNHSMKLADKKALDDAIAWSDKTSIAKQRKEDHDTRI